MLSQKSSSMSPFSNPECAEAMDSYLELQKKNIPKHLENNPETGEWESSEVFLQTRLFDINNIPFSSYV
jgi:hypothetical protein